MKKLFIAALLMSTCVMSQAITLDGTLKGLTNDTVLISSVPISKVYNEGQDEATKVDTLVAKKGVVKYVLNATEPMLLQVKFEQFKVPTAPGQDAYYRHDSEISLYMAPKEVAKVNVFYADSLFKYTVKASALNEDIAVVETAMQPVMTKVSNSIEDMLKGKIDREEYSKRMGPMMGERNALIAELVKNHANKPAAEYVVTKYASGDSTEVYMSRIESAVKGSLVKPMLDSKVKTIQKRKQIREVSDRNKGKDAEGLNATDFSLLDINEKPFTLSSLRGKFVILDFWGAWCGWCIKGMPALKEYYAKHKDVLEVVGVDCNDGKEQWRAAVKKHELPWIHVYNAPNLPADKNVAALYSITGYPTKYLIDPDGKIVVKIVGEDPEFFNKVDAAIAAYKK